MVTALSGDLENVIALTVKLQEVAFHLRNVIPVLKAMRTFIDPGHFLPSLRRFLKCGLGYENGMIFEGNGTFEIPVPRGKRAIDLGKVHKLETGLRGPTGAMTSTMSFVDAALGIRSSIDADISLKETMEDFRQFQPRSHVQEIDKLQHERSILEFIMRCNRTTEDTHAAAVLAYDDAVTAAAEFRLAHVDHISTYILNKVPSFVPLTEIKGTGGVPISSYLCRSALGTLDARIRPSQAASFALPTLCDVQCKLDMLGGRLSEKSYCHHIPDLFRRMSADRKEL